MTNPISKTAKNPPSTNHTPVGQRDQVFFTSWEFEKLLANHLSINITDDPLEWFTICRPVGKNLSLKRAKFIHTIYTAHCSAKANNWNWDRERWVNYLKAKASWDKGGNGNTKRPPKAGGY